MYESLMAIVGRRQFVWSCVIRVPSNQTRITHLSWLFWYDTPHVSSLFAGSFVSRTPPHSLTNTNAGDFGGRHGTRV